MKSELRRSGNVKPERGDVGGRHRWLGAPIADQAPTPYALELENERLRFLVDTLDAERVVLEARLATLREMLRARSDEADALRRRLEEVSTSSASGL